jgi:hypothetical protein
VKRSRSKLRAPRLTPRRALALISRIAGAGKLAAWSDDLKRELYDALDNHVRASIR